MDMAVLKRWVHFNFLDYLTTILRLPTFDRIKRLAFIMPDICEREKLMAHMVSF